MAGLTQTELRPNVVPYSASFVPFGPLLTYPPNKKALPTSLGRHLCPRRESNPYWFLRRYQDGEYCTLPHVIEMMNVELAQLLTILQTEPEISSYVSPFVDAYKDNNTEMLGGRIASAKIGIARLSSPALYYVLSGNDLSLDINNPQAPKIVCLANVLCLTEILL